ncbi:hypothetical protein EOL70_13060 [Leucothrix sargassi]|nr:hypothetical protein EOL70_13060 [Leucothrix sargassi]
MKKIYLITAITASLFVTTNASAEGTVAAKVGTLGGGLEYIHALSPKFAIGVGINGLSLSGEVEDTDVTYDADLDMQNISLLADYHPFANGFRISAGAYSNSNEFVLTATPNENNEYEINGNTYRTDETIESLGGAIDFDSISPYIGIGWGHKPMSGKGWGFDADLGVLFQGSPNVALSVTCVNPDSAACTELEDDVEAEEMQLMEDSEEFDVYPVLSIGVSYTF